MSVNKCFVKLVLKYAKNPKLKYSVIYILLIKEKKHNFVYKLVHQRKIRI